MGEADVKARGGLGVAALCVVLAVVSVPAHAAGRDGPTITLVAHDSFAVSKSVLAAFTAQTGVEVEVLQAGDGGAVLNQAVLASEGGEPLGDVLFGVDNTFLTRALDAGIFERYAPPALARVPDEYELDRSHHLTPVDHGDVCINYDKKVFSGGKAPAPTSLDDLTKPAYKGKLVVENPATSTPGLAFLLATIARYGETGWQDYWKKLRANDVKVDDSWETAYNGDFSQGANKGAYPLVVSYASSPPAAVYFSKPRPKTSPIGTMLDSCFRQVEFVGVLRGTEHRGAARRLVDFMLSERFQADIPLQMFVFPVRDGTPLPPVFVQFAEVPPEPLSLDTSDIGRHRDEWIEQWTNVVLR
jgi:thiamine transport system substrate-binding protein